MEDAALAAQTYYAVHQHHAFYPDCCRGGERRAECCVAGESGGVERGAAVCDGAADLVHEQESVHDGHAGRCEVSGGGGGSGG